MKLSAKINRIRTYKDNENIRYELYAIFSTLILDKEIFGSNPELKPFMKQFSELLGYHFEKDYLFKARPDVVSITISRLRKNNGDNFTEIISKLSNFIEGIEKETETKLSNDESDPDLDKIIGKYTK